MMMTSDMKPYPAYKDSGVEWLGEIPARWEVKRLKYAAPLRVSKLGVKPEDATYIGLENIESWTGRLLIQDQPESVESAVGRFEAGDVLFGKLRPYLAKAARPEFSGVSTSEILALRPVEYSQSYLLYSLLNKSYIHWVDMLTYGTKMPRVSPDQVGNSFTPLPPLSEQRAIAAFLDRETARIDALVAKKERLIELLQEKRTSLISHAVTKGLDPDVPLKASGVEWLGEIPVHWEIMRLKQASRIQGGFAFSTDSFGNEGIPVVRMNNIRRGVLDLDNVVRIPEHKCKDAFALNEGDIIYGLSGSIGDTGSLGNYAVVRKGDTPAQLNQRVARFRPMIDRITEKFLIGSLQTSVFYEQVLSYTTGTAQFNVSTNDIGNVVLALPPIKEHRAIAAFLDRETAPIDSLVAKVRKAIDRLKELRTVLISAAVTGKIDVRQAAA